jgi:hypothetical protein
MIVRWGTIIVLALSSELAVLIAFTNACDRISAEGTREGILIRIVLGLPLLLVGFGALSRTRMRQRRGREMIVEVIALGVFVPIARIFLFFIAGLCEYSKYPL